MPPAIIAGGIAAAGAIGGAVIGSHAQKKANSQAAETQNNATNAQLQLGHESLAFANKQAGASYDVLSPYASRGNVAGDAEAALLGLSPAPHLANPYTTSPAPALASAPAASPAPASAGPGSYQQAPSVNALASPQGAATSPVMNALAGSPPAAPPVSGAAPASAPAPGAAPAPAPPSGAYGAFNNFANSAGMQLQIDQAQKALEHSAGANGWLQSGAAIKAATDRAQGIALNNYFMPYMNLLGGQQAVGAGAASSIAGVGSNFGNTAANINGQMGNAINNGAQNIGNLQLANGQNQANMYGQIGSALGKFGSSFMPLPQY